MSSVIEDFFVCPSEALLESCTKEQLVQIAERFSVDLTSQEKRLKETIVTTLKRSLVDRGVIEVSTELITPSESFVSTPAEVYSESETKFPELSLQEKQLCLDAAKIRAERDDRAMKERAEERQFEERKLDHQLGMRRMELEFEKEREERAFQIKKLELELAAKTAEVSQANVPPVPQQHANAVEPVFDVHRNMRLVPPFSEKEVDKYFYHFERVALSMKWPKSFWTLLLQCVFTGKAQEVYSALSLEQSGEYDVVKSAVLHAYELVPEAYRQKFRNLTKVDECTHVEFAREKENLFDRWCISMKVTSKEQLRELVLLEEFKHCVPHAVATHLTEHKVNTLSEAAIMADEFVLTRPRSFSSVGLKTNDMSKSKFCFQPKTNSPVMSGNIRATVAEHSSKPALSRDMVCFYCKKPGHKISDCLILKKKERLSKPVALVFTSPFTIDTRDEKDRHLSSSSDKSVDQCITSSVDYTPFITGGNVSLPGSNETVPVRLLRDTGAAQSFLLEGILPLTSETATGTHVLVRGFEMGFVEVHLHRIHLSSAIVSGDVIVGVRSALPVPGITFILGNYLAGGNVWGRSGVAAPPIKACIPRKSDVKNCREFPDLFPACAVTRSMAKPLSENQVEVPLHDTFFYTVNTGELGSDVSKCPEQRDLKSFPSLSSDQKDSTVLQSESADTSEVLSTLEKTNVDLSDVDDCSLTSLLQISREDLIRALIRAQLSDDTLKPLFFAAGSKKCSDAPSSSYFLDDGLLCRTVVLHKDVSLEPKTQIVVPITVRDSVLHLAHQGLAGHTGVHKTYDRVLRQFYWPKVKRDVAKHIRSCHTCQITGKPNQKVPVAPLQPISVVSTPFEHLIIDCVGPLPRSKTGHQYLLTVMCQTTRYPAAYPLRSITTKSVLKALTNFMATFGIPKVIQSDQGLNFMSKQFSKALRQLRVDHNISSAYHPQSQGVLERFHQTLKSLLRSYCVELDADWEEGLPWMLLAIREVIQESLGFSPNELVFGHVVRGPTAVLAEGWRMSKPSENIADYVNGFRRRLYEARALAKKKLSKSQIKMQQHFDRKAKLREFQVCDQVLALLPLPANPFQAKFTGPYSVVKRLSNNNYLLNTPDRRKKVQVCHSNLLKLYTAPVRSVTVNVVNSFPESSPLFRCTSGDSLENADEDESFLSREKVDGRLKNFEILLNLSSHLSYLTEKERSDVTELVVSFPSLFLDVPGRYVSKFDLLKGYWQVPLTNRAKELSAFITPDAFLQYTVMPFGVRNAPATFQRLVNRILYGMSGCEAYLDDIVLYSSSWSEHQNPAPTM